MQYILPLALLMCARMFTSLIKNCAVYLLPENVCIDRSIPYAFNLNCVETVMEFLQYTQKDAAKSS